MWDLTPVIFEYMGSSQMGNGRQILGSSYLTPGWAPLCLYGRR